MNVLEPNDLGPRLRALAPPIDMPVDLIAGVRRRARRRAAARLSTASAGLAAVVLVAALGLPGLIGSAGPSDAQLHTLLAAGDAAPVRYTGPGIPPELAHTTLWLVGGYYSAPEHTEIVTYVKDGHPCLAYIGWAHDPPLIDGSSFTGGCALDDEITVRGSYGPLGPARIEGRLAVLYGPVPSNVRVVRADVNSGARLAERFVATRGTPASTKQRFFVFTAPNGTERGIDVDLTFYDANGDRVGGRHLHQSFDINGNDVTCPVPPKHRECVVVSATPVPQPS